MPNYVTASIMDTDYVSGSWLAQDKVDYSAPPDLAESDTPNYTTAFWGNSLDKGLKEISDAFNGRLLIPLMSASLITGSAAYFDQVTINGNGSQAHAIADHLVLGDTAQSNVGMTLLSNADTYIFFGDAGSNLAGGVGYSHSVDGLYLRAAAGDRVIVRQLTMYPGTDNYMSFGQASQRWANIYSMTGTFDGPVDVEGELYVTGAADFADTLTVASNIIGNGNLDLDSASPVLTIGDGTGSPSLILDKSDTGSAYIYWASASINRWRFAMHDVEQLNLARLDSAGNFSAYPLAFSTSATTTFGDSTLVYSASGATAVNIYKIKDGGSATWTELYHTGSTSSTNRHWTHQFNASEGLSWTRYNGANVLDIPLQMDYSDGLVTISGSAGLDVFGGVRINNDVGSAHNDRNDLVIGSTNATSPLGMTFLGSSSLTSMGISWGDADSSTIAGISYDHLNDRMNIVANGGNARLNSARFNPATDGALDLGADGARWNRLYLSTSLNIAPDGTAASTSADEITIGRTDSGTTAYGMTIFSSDTGTSHLHFGNNADNDAGRIMYQPASDQFVFYMDGTASLWMRNDGASNAYLAPYTSGLMSLGVSTRYWDQLYVNDATVAGNVDMTDQDSLLSMGNGSGSPAIRLYKRATTNTSSIDFGTAAGIANLDWRINYDANEDLYFERWSAGNLSSTPMRMLTSNGTIYIGGNLQLTSSSPNLILGDGTASPIIAYIKGSGGTWSEIFYTGSASNSTRRWVRQHASSNDQYFQRHDVSGNAVDRPLLLNWTNGNVQIANSIIVTGSHGGFSGSLTRLADGTSYLIAGDGIEITSASNGSVTIAAAPKWQEEFSAQNVMEDEVAGTRLILSSGPPASLTNISSSFATVEYPYSTESEYEAYWVFYPPSTYAGGDLMVEFGICGDWTTKARPTMLVDISPVGGHSTNIFTATWGGYPAVTGTLATADGDLTSTPGLVSRVSASLESGVNHELGGSEPFRLRVRRATTDNYSGSLFLTVGRIREV